jgi:hypothetical protein
LNGARLRFYFLLGQSMSYRVFIEAWLHLNGLY